MASVSPGSPLPDPAAPEAPGPVPIIIAAPAASLPLLPATPVPAAPPAFSGTTGFGPSPLFVPLLPAALRGEPPGSPGSALLDPAEPGRTFWSPASPFPRVSVTML